MDAGREELNRINVFPVPDGDTVPGRGVYSIRSKIRTIPKKRRAQDRPGATLRDLERAVEALEAHKANEVVALDLRRLCDATDYFVIASGTSDTHVRALAEHVEQALHAARRRPHHVEGATAGRWALLDYVDFVVHIFHPTVRDFYQLERLWADAPAVSVGANR